MKTVAVSAALLALFAAADTQAPQFSVDPLWPKPLGNHWILGSVTGVAVDAQDHVWIVHRGADSLENMEKSQILDPPQGSCCGPAPHVLEFDQAGTLVSHWGGKGDGYEWPNAPYGITVDAKGNVWIGGGLMVQPAAGRGGRGTAAATDDTGAPATGRAGAGGRGAGAGAGRGAAAPPAAADAQVLKFARDGKFLLQIGHGGKVEGSDSTTGLNKPSGIAVDAAANEVYVADGLGNHRIVVFDANTGAYKRHWGAYGEKPDDSASGPYDPNAAPAKQFRGVSCVKLAKDGKVYVCDRQNDRIQVFQKDGKFVKEGIVAKNTLGEGSVWDLAFSSDPQQRFVYVADGQNKKVRVLNRETLEAVTSFGDGGRLPGLFYGVGGIAVDSKGNVYTGENFDGKRVQKFNYKGLAAVR
jgi:autonomous glycyl radical cofactor GrcA